MNRADRRRHDRSAKAEAARKMKLNGIPLDAATIGRNAATHNTCPCWMCTHKETKGLSKLAHSDMRHAMQ